MVPKPANFRWNDWFQLIQSLTMTSSASTYLVFYMKQESWQQLNLNKQQLDEMIESLCISWYFTHFNYLNLCVWKYYKINKQSVEVKFWVHFEWFLTHFQFLWKIAIVTVQFNIVLFSLTLYKKWAISQICTFFCQICTFFVLPKSCQICTFFCQICTFLLFNV